MLEFLIFLFSVLFLLLYFSEDIKKNKYIIWLGVKTGFKKLYVRKTWVFGNPGIEDTFELETESGRIGIYKVDSIDYEYNTYGDTDILEFIGFKGEKPFKEMTYKEFIFSNPFKK
jgi:hypothetical protein